MTESKQLLLWDAVDAGDSDAVAAALAQGADPDKPMSTEVYLAWATNPCRRRPRFISNYSLGSENFYVLFEALDNLPVLKAILAARTRLDVVNHQIDDQTTALYQVASSFYFDSEDDEAILRSLLEAGATVDQFSNGRTPLQALCNRKWNFSLLKILLEYGASVTAMDQHGDTALHLAVDVPIIDSEWCLDYFRGAVQRCGHGGPLVTLGETGWVMVESGPGSFAIPIGPYMPKPEDNLPDYTALKGVRDVVKVLVEAGADPNAVNPHNGDTPLHRTTDLHSGVTYLEAVKALIEYGARPDIRNHEGRLARDFFFFDNDYDAKSLFERLAALSPDSEPVSSGS